MFVAKDSNRIRMPRCLDRRRRAARLAPRPVALASEVEEEWVAVSPPLAAGTGYADMFADLRKELRERWQDKDSTVNQMARKQEELRVEEATRWMDVVLEQHMQEVRHVRMQPPPFRLPFLSSPVGVGPRSPASHEDNMRKTTASATKAVRWESCAGRILLHLHDHITMLFDDELIRPSASSYMATRG